MFMLLCVPFGVRREKQPFLGDFISSEVDTQHRAHESYPGGAHFSLFLCRGQPEARQMPQPCHSIPQQTQLHPWEGTEL